MMEHVHTLIVEDSVYSADLNIRELKRAGFIVEYRIVANKLEFQKALASKHWDIILCDNSMPGFSGLQALEIRNQLCNTIPFVIVSEDISNKDLEKALQEGCSGSVKKEQLETLGSRVRECLK